jgi:hypothetical protein
MLPGLILKIGHIGKIVDIMYLGISFNSQKQPVVCLFIVGSIRGNFLRYFEKLLGQ